MNKILAITGATGKSGMALCKLIADNKALFQKHFNSEIRVLVRKTSNIENLNKLLPNAKFYVGDLSDMEFLKNAFLNVDTIMHIAGIHFSNEIVKAADYTNVRRLVFVHTTGVYSKYKKAGEIYRNTDSFVYKICKTSNIKLTILRPTMIYGDIKDNNMVKFIKMVDKLPVMPLVNNGLYQLQPVFYGDLGRAYFDVLLNEQATAKMDFNLSGEAPIYLKDMLNIIGNKLGKKVKFINVPFSLAYLCACLVYLFTIRKIDLREKVQRLCEDRIFSHKSAASAFGYSATSFDQIIQKEIEAYIKVLKNNK